MLDSTSNGKENTPLDLVPKRIRSGSHEEPTPPCKKHKLSESPTSAELSPGSSPGSISDYAPEEQDLIISSLVERQLRQDEVHAETTFQSPSSEVVRFKSPLETGPSSQNNEGISEAKSILATREDALASPLSPQPSNNISASPLPSPSNSMLPPSSPRLENLTLLPPSPRPKNITIPPHSPRPKSLTLPPPSPRPKNIILPPLPPRPKIVRFPPLPPRQRSAMPPPPRPRDTKASRTNNTVEYDENMSPPASASPRFARTLNSMPVKLRLKLTNNRWRKPSLNKEPAEDEGIDVTHEIHGSGKSARNEKVVREKGLVEETGTSKSSTSTEPPLTSSPMIRSSQIHQRIVIKPSKVRSVHAKAFEMARESNETSSVESGGFSFPNAPEPPYAITYRGLDLKSQIEAHKCKLCIPYGWKIPSPRLADPIIMGPLYRKVLHLRRDSDEIITTAIEFTDVRGEDNIHAFLDRAKNDAYNAGMPLNLEPTILAVRWDNGAQLPNTYRSIYSFYRDSHVSIVSHCVEWRVIIKHMRTRVLLKQNWMLWWTERDYYEDWNTDIS
ncbi:hypothetical protein EAE96_009584 [Botrytis aclada]|nr:hypothetical protein EAE96_009584 [Botrytis aclada]